MREVGSTYPTAHASDVRPTITIYTDAVVDMEELCRYANMMPARRSHARGAVRGGAVCWKSNEIVDGSDAP